MNRQQALRHVADHLIGYLAASTPDEIHETDDSRSEDKIADAMREITRRLSRMGEPKRMAGAAP